MLTRDQQYAVTVYDQVNSIKTGEANYQPYGAMAHKLPILIHTAGLAQALEFVHSRGKPIQKRLLADLAVTVGQNDTDTLLSYARSAPLSEYIRLTKQAMAALLWYKRFAQSILGVDASEASLEEEDANE